jgi:uncharacterized repeat protein (TIGR01451 family)
MKKFTLLFILNLAFLIFNAQNAKAQNVYIPDANFVTWLTQNYPSCMNGYMMNSNCSEIVNETFVYISGENIADLSGIEYFDNLTTLSCEYNQLTSLPTLPNSLTYLKCHNNQLTSLPTLPNYLTTLVCNNNQLTSLPVLPNSLAVLKCNSNQLTSLPSLPNSFSSLYCNQNQLSSLPTLPNLLDTLDCRQNSLSSLPVLPNYLMSLRCDSNQLLSLPVLQSSWLRELKCSNNQLTSLPALPNNLQTIHCNNNQLTSLPALPYYLLTLWCDYNQLTSLPSLPNLLAYLNCSNNLFTSFPTLPNSLFSLGCQYLNLTSLPTLPSSLGFLACNNNQLTSLPALPNSLLNLICNNNQLTSLPALPNSINVLLCNNNQLTSLPALPNSMGMFDCSSNLISSIPQVKNVMSVFRVNNNNILCITNLPQVGLTTSGNISNNPLTCVPNQTNYSLGLPLCIEGDTANNPNYCQSVANIVGNVFKDLNSNCNYDNTDLNSQNIPVKLYDTLNNFLGLNYTIDGRYSFSALQPSTFNIKINDVVLPLDMACGQSNTKTVTLTSTTQSLLNNNFPVVCDSAFDLEVHSVTPQGWVFPGQVHRLNTNLSHDINWYNLNCDSTSSYLGTVTIQVLGSVTYVAPAANALIPVVSGNTFTYSIADFNTLTPTSFGLKLMTDTTAQFGNQICLHVTISPASPDADTTNNEYDFCYNVLNSYDPNMKEVYPTNVLPGYDDWFTYTIHFQNTGTAPAFNIRLRDTLDTQLDRSTFEFLGASHTANTSLNGNILTVRFNNIMLPDSTSDYEGSMGYYQYRVKPLPNITNGSTIENTAYIYFDYNPAIVTNTTQNNFEMPVGNLVIAKNEAFSIYPNPSTGIFTIKSASTIKTIEVFNLIGETVLQQTNGNTINISSQPQGIYFCKVNGNSVVKLVKE